MILTRLLKNYGLLNVMLVGRAEIYQSESKQILCSN